MPAASVWTLARQATAQFTLVNKHQLVPLLRKFFGLPDSLPIPLSRKPQAQTYRYASTSGSTVKRGFGGGFTLSKLVTKLFGWCYDLNNDNGLLDIRQLVCTLRY
jgi:hypothetical protein